MQSDNDIILIDQPEDDLDNKIIYDEVITAIKKKKQKMQFVFETHNSNIPVLGDAERIFMVEYQDTKIDISQGNIDLKTTHKQVVDIMEGGKEAFNKRQLIYTSWKQNILNTNMKNIIRSFSTKKNPLKIPSIFAIITNASMHDANIL